MTLTPSEMAYLAAHLIFAFSIVGGLAILAQQGVIWLRTAEWPARSLYYGLLTMGFELDALAELKWAGVKTVVIWILELPLALVVAVAGVMISGAIGFLGLCWDTPS